MVVREMMTAAITTPPIQKVKSIGEVTGMSRIFRAHHAYDPYDPYLHGSLNQRPLYYWRMSAGYRSKHGKGCKDHVIQTFWYESKSKILSCPLPLPSLLEEECISL